MKHSGRRVLTTSRKLEKHQDLTAFLDSGVEFVSQATGAKKPAGAEAVLAWGRKPSAVKAESLAGQLRLPIWRLEDGFIHSLGQGVLGAASCSLVVDKQGIYYDATRVSDLEVALVNGYWLDTAINSPALLERANKLITQILRQRISKYNNASLDSGIVDLPSGKKILVVDQTAGDMSLQYGLIADGDAQTMLEAALAEYPDATVLLKTHPDVIAGRKKGCVDQQALPERVVLITEQINPLVLLEQVDHVYVLTSQLGFEALMLGKSVTCFGVPFYAGWGLTDDRADQSHAVFARRCVKRALPEVFATAYLLYSRYVHPETGKSCELEAVVEFIGEQTRQFVENEGRLFAFGFSRWKRNYIRRFLYAPGHELNFVAGARQAKKQGFTPDCHIVAWGERAIEEAGKLALDYEIPVWRIEDGFIRSAGLGSDYTPPLSLVLDKRGIYYDPTRQSDLEYLLQNTSFSANLIRRAADLRTKLLNYELSKYNLGGVLFNGKIAAKKHQSIILVPGQVEDDASIRKGCRDIASNAELLKAVRSNRPDAYIIYKPHPDVISGNRKGRVSDTILSKVSDLVLDDVSVTDCLDAVDEVHTMTSLVGFEGLLRNKKVVCYGLPFYAGWGLTEDRYTLLRRKRVLKLDELVAATLILYPRYMNWQTGAFTTPETALEILRSQLLEQGGKKKNKIHVLKRLWAKAVHIYHGVFTFRY